MRLTELNPQWLYLDGKRVGFIFDSPVKKKELFRQTCFAQCTSHDDQEKAIIAVIGDDEMALAYVQQCRKDFAWIVVGGIDNARFETISVTPSLDGSAGGLWHGYITGGAIVGGI